MIVKTSELDGTRLDWAVAKCEGLQWATWRKDGWSNEWSMGGPIIEREVMRVSPNIGRGWSAQVWRKSVPITEFGPTPLIAAMRCYVASKLGEEINIPEELT